MVEDLASKGARPKPLRILFSMRNFWYVKLFDSVIRELASRGHDVHILAERGETNDRAKDWNDAAVALATEYPTVSFGWAPRQVEDDWADLRVMVRLSLDHLRFLAPAYATAPMLGARARRRTPAGFVKMANSAVMGSALGRRVMAWGLKAAERAIPTSEPLARRITEHKADVVLVTPLLTLGSEQVDVLRTTRQLGVPTALCVGSWDHLSSKALIRQQPDQVFVWNHTQMQEAEALHGVARERVVVTGAQCFDQWFGRAPSLARDAFCRRVGLDPAKPFVLYVCSALLEGSPSEAEFVVRWARAVRASADPRLREAGILVRPHPKRGFEWATVSQCGVPQSTVSLEGIDNAVLWPSVAAAPFDHQSKNDYFDSMFHSAVIVGLNSSAQIEGGIVGRAVHTILLPEFHDSQEGTLHYPYLLNGGLLRTARSLAEHVGQLAGSLAEADPSVHHNRGFVENFVRPHGLNRSATPIFADAVERLASLALVPRQDTVFDRALRWALTPAARRASGTFIDHASRERRRREKVRARVGRMATLARQREAEKARVLAERQVRHEAEAREREAALAQAREAKLRVKADKQEAKRRAREARLADSQRRKRRAAWSAKLAFYVKRVMHPFSSVSR